MMVSASSGLISYTTYDYDTLTLTLTLTLSYTLHNEITTGTLTSDVENDMSKSFFSNLKAMPSQPERRARQAVLLAQKVLEAEKQRDLLKKEVKSLLTDLKGTSPSHSVIDNYTTTTITTTAAADDDHTDAIAIHHYTILLHSPS